MTVFLGSHTPQFKASADTRSPGTVPFDTLVDEED